MVAWLAGGLLRDLLAPLEERRVVPAQALDRFKCAPRLGAVELNVAVAIVDLLFLAFVVVQFRYLFGGQDLVARPPTSRMLSTRDMGSSSSLPWRF